MLASDVLLGSSSTLCDIDSGQPFKVRSTSRRFDCLHGLHQKKLFDLGGQSETSGTYSVRRLFSARGPWLRAGRTGAVGPSVSKPDRCGLTKGGDFCNNLIQGLLRYGHVTFQIFGLQFQTSFFVMERPFPDGFVQKELKSVFFVKFEYFWKVSKHYLSKPPAQLHHSHQPEMPRASKRSHAVLATKLREHKETMANRGLDPTYTPSSGSDNDGDNNSNNDDGADDVCDYQRSPCFRPRQSRSILLANQCKTAKQPFKFLILLIVMNPTVSISSNAKTRMTGTRKMAEHTVKKYRSHRRHVPTRLMMDLDVLTT